jgi:putative MFS transporter
MSTTKSDEVKTHTGIRLNSPAAFWTGITAVACGVLAHLPEFVGARSMGFHMAHMPMSPLMLAGMLTIVVGLALTSYGLVPLSVLRRPPVAAPAQVHFRALDSARLTGEHWSLLFVLGIALVIDVMKPATLGFVVPGLKSEYGISTRAAAALPFMALTGTTIGSLLWGVLADRIGRRAAILLSSILFVATSICGFMPSFAWNLFMCFLMGMSAGGMLPIVYALMTEAMPAKNRGWLVVLHGGMGTVLGYLLASGLATVLEPLFTWRSLWLAGLPTGLLMLILNRWIPESPRFLLENGRFDEAEVVMRRFGVAVTPDTAPRHEVAQSRSAQDRHSRSKVLAIFRTPYRLQTITVGMYGLGWGLVNWGFLTFTPTILRDRGLDAQSANEVLFWSALIAVPATLLVAYLYGFWSSKKTMILFALITGTALLLFAGIDPGSKGRGASALIPLMVLLLIGSGGIISMLSPYSAEVYPTQLRGTGSGFAAGSSKVGGILAPPLTAMVLSAVPGFSLISIIAAGPVLLSALVVLVAGIETRDRALEELTMPAIPAPQELN